MLKGNVLLKCTCICNYKLFNETKNPIKQFPFFESKNNLLAIKFYRQFKKKKKFNKVIKFLLYYCIQ